MRRAIELLRDAWDMLSVRILLGLLSLGGEYGDED